MQGIILNHYPPVIRNIKEMQQIAKAEDIEFSKLGAAMGKVSRDMFILTAGEQGIGRFEKMLGIVPGGQQSLEDRRIYIISMMNRREMSLAELKAMLSAYSEGITLKIGGDNDELIISVRDGERHIPAMLGILEEMIPLHVHIRFNIRKEPWRLDGTVKMDGSRLLGAEFKEWIG